MHRRWVADGRITAVKPENTLASPVLRHNKAIAIAIATRPCCTAVARHVRSAVDLGLPLNEAYLGWDFHRDIEQDLAKAEK